MGGVCQCWGWVFLVACPYSAVVVVLVAVLVVVFGVAIVDVGLGCGK